MWQKRLEKQRFAWPRANEATVTRHGSDLNLLLDGYDIWQIKPHRTLHYASMV